MTETKIPKPSRWGMINYTILEDGNLQGIWTHSDKHGDGPHRQLFLEIARKNDVDGDTRESRAELVGEYHCAWVDVPADLAVTQLMTIDRQGTVYTFQWRVTNGGVSFRGVGMRLGPSTLVVTFWPGDVAQFTLVAG